MEQPEGFEFPLAKAEYLLTRKNEPGKGGDKQNFWRRILGFTSASDIREAILSAVSVDILKAQRQDRLWKTF